MSEQTGSHTREREDVEVAILGGGCFWCIEPIFDNLRGVISVESGYAGGNIPHPTYQQVCSGRTGHAEVVQITFDPRQVAYRDLLQIFFASHDPTTLNRQGADVGTQYRSVVFYDGEQQKQIAEEVIRDVEARGLWPSEIVTEISPLDTFYVAEDYHQEYFANNPDQAYCSIVIAPKVAKFRKQYADQLKA
jgi:peptide-methionine (S)-S-oxide reductase